MSGPSSHGEAWRGDWQDRLAAELKRRGFGSLRAFSKENRCTTYTAIANALDGPFAPIQMMMAIRSEFRQNADAVGFVADSLFRYLSEYTRAPATQAKVRESQAAQAIGACGAAIGDANDESLFSAWRTLRGPILEGWLPTDTDDPSLRLAIDILPWQL